MVTRTLDISLCLALLFSQTSSCSNSKTTSNSTSTVNKAQSIPPAKAQSNITGLWGGQGISFEASDEGVKIEFDCARGTIDQKLVPDSKGMFLVYGFYVREHPGPTREEQNAGKLVAYSGSIEGPTMTLTVTVAQTTLTLSQTQTKETLGTYKLTQGQSGRLRKCG